MGDMSPICPQDVPNKMGQNFKMGQSYINFEKVMINSMTEIDQA